MLHFCANREDQYYVTLIAQWFLIDVATASARWHRLASCITCSMLVQSEGASIGSVDGGPVNGRPGGGGGKGGAAGTGGKGAGGAAGPGGKADGKGKPKVSLRKLVGKALR
jgi:hypothetical protein